MKPAFAFDVCHGLYRAAREVLEGNMHSTDLVDREKYLWRPGLRPRLAEYVADFALAGQRALASPHLASRLVLFRVHYLGGAELHAARAHLGIGELTWEQWSDDVKARVGRELLRRRIFPPRGYFRDASEPRTPRVGARPQRGPHAAQNDGRDPIAVANGVDDPHKAQRDARCQAPAAKAPPRLKRAQPIFVRDPRRGSKLAS
ncbi:MAG TPA: hypothetical protein VGZ48_01925 [Candidatus Acidoferrales bacterium]|jgi:hypothetical protein|nr:hypothetical protein [Candidatus Acidoferrales bacterium]